MLASVRAVVKGLNPDARLIEADFARVPLTEVLDTGRFDFEKAHEHPLWFKELNGFADHIPETEEYGVGTFVYRARRPFDPQRFAEFTQATWPGLIRAKGLFWLATRPAWVGDFSLAGATARTQGMGFWWASVPKQRWPDHPEWAAMLKRHWAPGWGDRRQELVFIGAGMDETAIRAALDACLVGSPNPAKFDPQAFRHLPDPFPARGRSDAA